MISIERNIGLARRKRSIAYCAFVEETETERLIQTVASTVKATFFPFRTSSELSSFLEQEKESVCLIVLEAHIAEIVSVARMASSSAPIAELVLLANDEQQIYLQQQLGPAPRLGKHWQFVSPATPQFVRHLESAYQRADQRRATRTTLDRFNARLTTPRESVDDRELRQLIISDRFLSSVLESTFDAVIMIDRVGNIAAFNPSAEKLFGRTQQQVLSHPIGSLSSGDWQKQIGLLSKFSRAGELVQSSIEVEAGTKHVEVAVTPVYDTARNTIATSLIVRDITSRIQAEHALRTNEKLAAVGRLASSIAHEINNPLDAVTNLVYIARQITDDPEVQKYLDLADHELRRMSSITSQTLRFHKQASAPKLVSAEELLESVLVVYQARFLNSGVGLQSRLRAPTPIPCFEGEIRQVLNNLVGNAIDAMHGTGGLLLLRSRESTNWKNGEKGVMITVADTGSGMSPPTIKKIFEAFYTTKGMMGTGLGLWISSEIVVRHRGILRVRSRQEPPASGTVFTLFLPYVAAIR
jgi:PAS domain S-box-containing protein